MPTINKYTDTLKKYTTNLKDEQISKEVNELLKEKFAANNNKKVYQEIFSCLDYTSLNSGDNKESTWKFVEKANKFDDDLPYPNVAAICVFPNMVEIVREGLVADIKVVAVAGGFPSGQTFIEVKVAEVALAKMAGADEIDIVLNMGCFIDGNYAEMCEEITEIKATCGDTKLKVILETGILKTAANVATASILALYSGADFIKTSTGKIETGATPEAAYVMCKAIKEYTKITGEKVGFKASGGINTVEDAVKYYTIVKEVLGKDYTNKESFRIGASRLADQLIESIDK